MVLPVKIKYRCLEFVSWNVRVQLHCLVEGGQSGSSRCPSERLTFLLVEDLVLSTTLCHFVLLSSVVSAQGTGSHGTCTKQGAEGQGGDLVLTKWAA